MLPDKIAVPQKGVHEKKEAFEFLIRLFSFAGGKESTEAFPSPRSRASDGTAERGRSGAARWTGRKLGAHLLVHYPGIPGSRAGRVRGQEDEFRNRYEV